MKPRRTAGYGSAPSVCIGIGLLLFAGATGTSWAVPRIGYIYPAGGQAGSTFQVVVGGQGLDDPVGIIISADGVTAEPVDHFKELPTAARIEMSDKVQDLRSQVRKMKKELAPEQLREEAKKLMASMEITEKNLLQLREYYDRRRNPKRQRNNQIGEMVTLQVKVAANAAPGLHYFRLLTATGLSNAMRFEIGQHTEAKENDPWPFDLLDFLKATNDLADISNAEDKWDRVPVPLPAQALPVTINGQILPGEIDEYTFRAKQGDKLVMALEARRLVPYLADAVPGWFQAVLTLHDSNDQELAYADDFRFDPDPVVFFKIPQDGEYRVKVRDAIYRGREDFVYRLTIGQLPFLTGLYPLGGKAGTEIELNYQGGNLSEHVVKRYPVANQPGLLEVFAANGTAHSNAIPFHVDTVPEEAEREPNERRGTLNEVACPGIINGAISKPGDVDFFRVSAHSKATVFEVFARRLGSPLDATLTAYDDAGREIGSNDDYDNPAAGLITHHADSRLVVSGTGAGSYYVRVADRMGHGSIYHHYRLKVSPAKPSFALRVTPGSLTARPGGGAQLTAHVLRMDGFDGEVRIKLEDPLPGFHMPACTVPADKEVWSFTVKVPDRPTEYPVSLRLQGLAEVEGKDLVVDAVPAEDTMQAFAYKHLVPVDALLVDVRVPPEKAEGKKRKKKK